MEENVVKSRKINYDKKIKLCLLLLAVFFGVTIIISLVDDAGYKKTQDAAVASMLAVSNEYARYQDDYSEMLKKMERSFHGNPSANYALGRILTEMGYGDINRGSYYLSFSNFFDYTINKYGYYGFTIDKVLYILEFAFTLVFLIIIFRYKASQKEQMVIYEDRIVCQKGNITDKEFFLKDIKSVEFCGKNGLRLLGNGIKCKISMLENCKELKVAIMNRLTEITEKTTVSVSKDMSADSIVKFKELLDAGIITQEEFDSKKKQLLGL